MKSPLLFASCLLLAVGHPLLAQQMNQGQAPLDSRQNGVPAAAQAAVDAWIVLMDDNQYAHAWQTAASIFQRAVPQTTWTNLTNSHRTPLGKMVSRKLRSATFTRSLPGTPPGQYVVVLYDSAFEHKKTAVETATVALDVDGQWHVCGYFVR